MATALREIELGAPLQDIDDLNGYDRCMLVLRWRGRIVQRAFLPVDGGRLAVAALAGYVRSVIDRHTLNVWLHDALGYDERRTVEEYRPTATVAICTRERPEDLRRTLESVTQLAHVGHETLVIDNAPRTRATRSVLDQFPAARYICEPRPGLNAARNRAMREAAGEVVAFTDDDAAPEPGWLDALLANFSDRRVLCTTGLTLPAELETTAQELFEQHCPFARGFVRRVFDGHHDNPLAVGPVGAGANMAIRRSVPEIVGPFDERLDAGTPTRSGGDHEMFARILSAGYRIVYEPAAVSWHRHRRTEAELLETVRGYGVGVYAMWTGMLIERRELGVLKLAWSWFRSAQLPALLAAFGTRSPDSRTAIRLAEMRGCLHGPRAWFAAARQHAGLHAIGTEP